MGVLHSKGGPEIVADLIVDTAIFVAAFVLQGLAFSYLWGWFVVPLGVMSIGLLHAYGLSVLVRFATTNITWKEELREKNERARLSVLFPLVCLFFGYIVHLFV